MSQYPSPYLPPNVMPQYGAPPPDLLKPGRRASVLMFVLGGLLTAVCLLDTVSTLATPTSEFAKQMQEMPGASQQLKFTAGQLKAVAIGMESLCILVGLSFAALGMGVRRGGKVSTIAAIVLTVVALAVLGIMLLAGVVFSLQNPLGVGMVCVLLIPTAILIWLGIWLIPAARALSGMSLAQQQYQAQYWQYQQNMQAYHQQQAPPTGYPTQAYPTQGHPPQGYPQAAAPPQAQPPQPPPAPPVDPNSPPPGTV